MERLVMKLDSWHFWVGVAYFGLVGVVVALWVLFGRTAAEQASRNATQRAAAITQVQTCFTAVKNAPVSRGFVAGQEALVDNGIIANRAALERASVADPLTQVRLHSLRRLNKAKNNLIKLRDLIKKTTPKKASCIALARQLHVNPTRFLHPRSSKTG